MARFVMVMLRLMMKLLLIVDYNVDIDDYPGYDQYKDSLLLKDLVPICVS